MKCPQCGYFNLPGAPTCGGCRAALTEKTDAPASFDELYPPRARNRTVRDHVRTPFQKVSGRLRLSPAQRVGTGSSPGVAVSAAFADMLPWLIASLAVIPGAGHLLLCRQAKASLLLAATAVLVGLIVLLIRSVLSDVLLWALLALSVYSVWDAANVAFPENSNDDSARTYRALRLFFVSVGVVASSAVAISLFFGQWYALWVFNSDQAAPAFLRGDGLMVRRLPQPERQLRRGDVAVYSIDGTILSVPRTERVVGLPGDRVTGRENRLWVNGRPVPPSALPMTFQTLAAPVDITVPDGQVCLWRGLSGNRDEAANATPYLLVGAEQIQGQAIAIYQPPSRRRWFR